jgi:hypothetical protein
MKKLFVSLAIALSLFASSVCSQPVNTFVQGSLSSCSRSTTWNPSDKGSNITLSNGNLTATGATVWNSVRGTTSSSTGKLYFETVVTATDAAWIVGLGTSAMSLTSYVGNSATSGGVDIASNTIFVSGMTSAAAAAGSWTVSDRFDIAVDLGAGKIWYGKNGTWTGSGVPSTGTAPNITFTPSLTLFIAWAGNLAADSATLRTKTSQFSDTIPVGFTAWDGC